MTGLSVQNNVVDTSVHNFPDNYDVTSNEGSASASDDHIYTIDELAAMDANTAFIIPSPERLDEIKIDAIKAMTPASEEMLHLRVEWRTG